MNVRDLIERLKELPQDIEVTCTVEAGNDCAYGEEIRYVELRDSEFSDTPEQYVNLRAYDITGYDVNSDTTKLIRVEKASDSNDYYLFACCHKDGRIPMFHCKSLKNVTDHMEYVLKKINEENKRIESE